MSKEQHVIFGTGPVGCWIARTLCDKNIPVRAVNRSGQRPELMPDQVEMIAFVSGLRWWATKSASLFIFSVYSLNLLAVLIL